MPKKTIVVLLALAGGLAAEDGSLAGLFQPANVRAAHCDLKSAGGGALRATFWRGYETTGFETTRLPVSDFRRWKSLRFEVENPYREAFSVFVRMSSQPAHPAAETYTGGTFDGYVIGPGRSTVEISLEDMRSPDQHPVDAGRIAWLGIYFQPLFLRDGMELVFTQDHTFVLSNARLSEAPAKLQKQPYGDLLFRQTEPALRELRRETEQALSELGGEIERARAKGIETAYAEIYPFLARIAFEMRLVAFWQNRADEQRRALEFLLEGTREARRELGAAPPRAVPAVPEYAGLAQRDGYFRLNNEPVLLFGMLYNAQGPLRRWFANAETDYGTQLVAGATRHDVERQPIWEAYRKYPDTHRVGWNNADHLIRDANSWEVLGPPVSICLESPHTREAIAAAIERFERQHAGDRDHLVQNMGYEYTYVCYCDYTRRMWRDWLRARYGNVESANRIWGTAFANLAAVPMPRPENAGANRALWFDWASFNQARFLDQLRWTRDQVRRGEPRKALTVGSPYFAFDPAFWTGVDEEGLADSGVTTVVLEENYQLDTLMPEYLHALAGGRPVMDFEYHGVIPQILPSFLHGDAAISMWWWNDEKRWTPNEPINEWTTNFPQSYTIPLGDLAKAMRDSLDLRRLSREIAALASAPRPVALLYSRSSMLQQAPAESEQIGTFPYLSELRRTYRASQLSGLYVGLTTEKRILAGDLDSRKVLVLPGAEFVPEAVVEAIWGWVERGGALVVIPDSLLADEQARPVDRLKALGVRLRRREPAPLAHGEKVVTQYNAGELPPMPFRFGAARLEAAGGRQILRCAPESVAARFADGVPALLRVPRGRGVIYWLAAPLRPASWREFLSAVARQAGLDASLEVLGGAEQVEYRVASLEGRRLAYLYNDSGQRVQIVVKPGFAFREILDRRREIPLPGGKLDLPAGETALVEFRL